MHKTLRLSSLTLGLGLLAGCGASSGFLRDATSSNRLDIQLPVAGVRYVKSVSGSASIGAMFCAIPGAGDLYKDAMSNLHGAARLQPNQVVMNLREDFTFRTWFGFYCSRSLTMSGDVFELTPAATPATAPAASGSAQ
jgi:hypothetical protein